MAIRVIALNRDVSSMSHCIEIISHSFSILLSVEYGQHSVYEFFRVLSITSRFFGENSDCYALAYEATHIAYCLKICWDHSCGYSKSCPDGLVGLFPTKVVTGHVGPAPKTIMVC